MYCATSALHFKAQSYDSRKSEARKDFQVGKVIYSFQLNMKLDKWV